MLPDSPFNQPVSSYQAPVTVPDVDPDAAPLVTIQINDTWVKYLIGAAKQLLLQSTWDTQDKATLDLVQERAFTLLSMLKDTPVSDRLIGEIIMFGAVSGLTEGIWVACDGSELSRVDYSELFTVIGTTWGDGNGTTSFNVPDFRSHSPMGTGQWPGLALRSIGQHVGVELQTIDANQMPAHSHRTWSGTQYAQVTPGAGVLGLQTGGITLDIETSVVGQGQPFTVVHPSVVVPFFIKAK